MTKTGSPFELLNLMLNIMLNLLHWTEMTSSAYPPASYSSTHTYISSFSPHLPSSSAATACSQNLGR